jgi:hypothetical protein
MSKFIKLILLKQMLFYLKIVKLINRCINFFIDLFVSLDKTTDNLILYLEEKIKSV